ncbi:MAG: hypothetical protein ACI9DK_000195 [Vicingaceae bacterium]|jgi:hypothetical protein
MKTSLLSAVILFGLSAQAQHSTLRFTDDAINLSQKSVLVVPFESKMYLSDINKALAETNSLTSNQIIQRFTSAIDQSIYYAFAEKCSVSSFYQVEDSSAVEDLKYVFDNLELEYELVSKTVKKSKAKELKDKLNREEDDSYQRGRITNGQIETKRDVRERYMKAVISDNSMLDSMHFKFNNDFFLFVNQLDIKNDYSDMIAVQKGTFDRIIKLHYTLYAKDGSILTTGISKTYFSNKENNINTIITNNFPILARYIFEDLFPPVEEKSNSKIKLKNPWK